MYSHARISQEQKISEGEKIPFIAERIPESIKK